MKSSAIKTVLIGGALMFAWPAAAQQEPKAWSPVTHGTVSQATERNQAMVRRLEQIKDMDVNTLTRGEKKELRKEVKKIQEELKKNGGGIYISTGVILIIILLIILL